MVLPSVTLFLPAIFEMNLLGTSIISVDHWHWKPRTS